MDAERRRHRPDLPDNNAGKGGLGEGGRVARDRERAKRTLQEAEDIIDRTLSSDNQGFLRANQQEGGQ